MNDSMFGVAVRATRINRSWSQQDLADAAEVSRGTIVRIEQGHLDEMSLRILRKVAHALEISVELLPRSRGAGVERVVNARHSALAERVARWIGGLPDWIVRPEVSFSIWGERGVVDLLAWHTATRSLIVLELKTAIVDVGEILGTLDRKRRLAREIVKDFGWEPSTVSVCLIVGDARTNHRRLAAHVRTFRAVLPEDGRGLAAWLRRPAGPIHALTFLSDDRRGDIRRGFATLSRVSPRRSRGRCPPPRSAEPAMTAISPPNRPGPAP